jgi:hypothetical protein
MLRHVAFISLCLVSANLRAEAPSTIGSGARLDVAKATLEKFGYRCSDDFKLAMLPSDKEHGLAFSQLDDHTTLVLGYLLATKVVDSLQLINYPERKPKALRTEVHIALIEIGFEKEGVYLLKIKRNSIHVQLPTKSAQASK